MTKNNDAVAKGQCAKNAKYSLLLLQRPHPLIEAEAAEAEAAESEATDGNAAVTERKSVMER